MDLFHEYENATEVFSDIGGLEVKGWNAGYPGNELKLSGRANVLDILELFEGGVINDQHIVLPLHLKLAASSIYMTFKGDITKSYDKYLDDDTLLDMDMATPWQKTCYDQALFIVEHMMKGVCEQWDLVDDLYMEMQESGDISLPEGFSLPTGVTSLVISRSPYRDFNEGSVSDYMDKVGGYLSDYFEEPKETSVAQLTFMIDTTDGDELELGTDGYVWWRTADELSCIITHFLNESGLIADDVKEAA